jgi:(1->4)-alpha-D-glucan 1-alpha-D-glucosylmutase
MGIIVDFVPNHMGIGSANPWWWDVLENGPSSVYAPYFDIDFQPVKDELMNKVLVPVLGGMYGEVLERGELRLERDGGTFHIRYWDERFPLSPRSVPKILTLRIGELEQKLGATDVHVAELLSIVTALEKLAPRHEADAGNVVERAREKEVAKRRLAVLFAASEPVREHVDANVRILCGTPGEPRSFDPLGELLENQAYRLAYWRVAGEEINYRRFFDINNLAAVRMEDARVFEDTHKKLLELVAAGDVDGIRVDHPDGLYAPDAYFRLLRERGVPYLVVEKILEARERLPAGWPVDGTTGYEFLNAANGLFIDTDAAAAFDSIYRRFVGPQQPYAELCYWRKKLIMGTSMASEISMLARRLNRISERDRRTRDFTLGSLRRALTEYIACLPVYRTYADGEVDARDRAYVATTIIRAERRAVGLGASVFRFLREILLGERRDDPEFVPKLQQITGAVMAKAVEDTAFYVYARFLALNEVGGDPERFGTPPESFHRMNLERLQVMPGSLNATATHDTKRGEDTRLRMAALSEMPSEWLLRVRRWSRLSRAWKTLVDGALAPDRNDELFIYQTLVGAWGSDDLPARMKAYLEKAQREAKVHTTWTNPNEAYEGATAQFLARLLASDAFVADFAAFHAKIAAAALVSSLAQTALKLASPGVTDVYQGADLTDLSLVDPDNRRPVDFAARQRALGGLTTATATLADGRAKLLLLREGLRFRRAHPELFLRGEYLPLHPHGPCAKHVVAFERRLAAEAVVCVVPRLVLSRPSAGWQGGVAFDRPIQDLVTGRTIAPTNGELPLTELFGEFPVVLATVRPKSSA